MNLENRGIIGPIIPKIKRPVPTPEASWLTQKPPQLPESTLLEHQNFNDDQDMELMNRHTNDSIPSQNDKSFNFAFMFIGNSEQNEN